jgi:hypothetical protein
MAVGFDVASESHTGTTGSTSAASFTWNHAGGASARGALVFVFGVVTNALPPVTSVTYGGVTMTEIPYSAIDTDTEPGSVKAFYLDNCGTGTKAVVVNRTNNTHIMYAVCYTVTAAGATEVYLPGVKTRAGSAAEQTAANSSSTGTATSAGLSSVTDGSPGTDSLRFMGRYQGTSSVSAAGSGSTAGPSIDFGLYVIDTFRETTAGQGARNVGGAAISDDLAWIALAVREKPPVTGSFTAAAVIEHPDMAGSLMADAVLRHLDTAGSATANAVLRHLDTLGSVAASAVIKNPDMPGSFAANAVIRKTQTGVIYVGNNDGTGGAVKSISSTTYTFTPSANSIIQRTQTPTFAASAVIRSTILSGQTPALVQSVKNTGTLTRTATAGNLLFIVCERQGAVAGPSPSGWNTYLDRTEIWRGSTTWMSAIYWKVADGSESVITEMNSFPGKYIIAEFSLKNAVIATASNKLVTFTGGYQNAYGDAATFGNAPTVLIETEVMPDSIGAGPYPTATADVTWSGTDKTGNNDPVAGYAYYLTTTGGTAGAWTWNGISMDNGDTARLATVVFQGTTLTAAAIVSKPTVDTFAASAVIAKTVAPTFTAAANIKGTVAASTTVDAIQLRTFWFGRAEDGF